MLLDAAFIKSNVAAIEMFARVLR